MSSYAVSVITEFLGKDFNAKNKAIKVRVAAIRKAAPGKKTGASSAEK